MYRREIVRNQAALASCRHVQQVVFRPMRLLFCGSGWLPIVEMIAARLPRDALIAHWDRRTPLAEVVADVDVLLPSNAAITADVIAAARALRLIQQPAAGA